MNIRIKKLDPKAQVPVYAYPGDSCVDLFAVSIKQVTDTFIEYGTGLAIEVPEGYIGVSNQRSSISKKNLLWNTSGEIDPGYRGEVTCRFYCKQKHEELRILWQAAAGIDEIPSLTPEELQLHVFSYFNIYQPGDAIAQFKILPRVQLDFEVVEELSASARGAGGHGSSGKH